MSNLAYARQLPTPAPVEHPRHIEIAPTRAQRMARPKVAYAAVTIGSLFLIFASQLLLSIAVSDGAIQMQGLLGQQKELLRTQDALSETLQVLESPQNLAIRAAGRGMVPNASPLAIDLSTRGVYPLPGSADPMGCGGACNLITNSLLTGLPPIAPTAPVAGHAAGTTPPPVVAPQTGQAPTGQAATGQAPTGQTAAGQAPTTTDVLPAPVTR